MLAAYHGHAELVKLLAENGADPNRRNDRGQSPLAGAVFKQEDAVIEVGCICLGFGSPQDPDKRRQALLEAGADPEHGSPSPFQCIAMFKQEERWKAKFEQAPGRGKASQDS